MRAYDEFDNLIFTKEGEVMDDKDRKAFIKDMWAQFDRVETVRMDVGLTKFESIEEIGDAAKEAGMKLKDAVQGIEDLQKLKD